MDTNEVLELIHRVADEVIMPRFQHLAGGEIDEKTPGDYVTVADREAEIAIADELRRREPGVVVVGEEAAFADESILDAVGVAEVCYLIDPIDGTRNFVQGRPDFGVMLAECRRGEPVRSWLWQPVHQHAFVAEAGAGATRDGVPLAKHRGLPEAPLGVSSKRARIGFDAGGRLTPTRMGLFCAAVDYTRVATGELDYVVYEKVKPWDHVPGTLLLRECGGEVLQFDGLPYQASSLRQGLVGAGTPEIARLVVDLWQHP